MADFRGGGFQPEGVGATAVKCSRNTCFRLLCFAVFSMMFSVLLSGLSVHQILTRNQYSFDLLSVLASITAFKIYHVERFTREIM